MKTALFAVLFGGAVAISQPRRVVIKDQKFVSALTGEEVVLTGPNVVVKGPPYLPEVSGDTYCVDVVNDECQLTGTWYGLTI